MALACLALLILAQAAHAVGECAHHDLLRLCRMGWPLISLLRGATQKTASQAATHCGACRC